MSRGPKRAWSEGEDAIICALYRDKSSAEIAAILGVSSASVENRKRRLGCTSGRSGGKIGSMAAQANAALRPPKPKGFTREQIAWAIANLRTDPEARMIALMVAEGRTAA